MKRLLQFALRTYKRWISPALPASCRYVPSCSEYAAEAVAVHGAIRGSWMALKRLLRCHPFTKGGYDPVPVPDSKFLTSDSRLLATEIHHIHEK